MSCSANYIAIETTYWKIHDTLSKDAYWDENRTTILYDNRNLKKKWQAKLLKYGKEKKGWRQ